MTKENHPEQYAYPNPSREQVEEMALLSAFRRVVDDLFTHKIVAETLADIEDGKVKEPGYLLVTTFSHGVSDHYWALLTMTASIVVLCFMRSVYIFVIHH